MSGDIYGTVGRSQISNKLFIATFLCSHLCTGSTGRCLLQAGGRSEVAD